MFDFIKSIFKSKDSNDDWEEEIKESKEEKKSVKH